MKFRGVIFDLDGTAMPSRMEALPSGGVIEAVRRIKGRMKVAAATGRSYDWAKAVLGELGLVEPCIVLGGGKIVDPQDGKVIWEKRIAKRQLEKLLAGEGRRWGKWSLDDNSLEAGDVWDRLTTAGIVYVEGLSEDEVKKVKETVDHIPGLAAHRVPSWDGPDRWDIHVTHAEATKTYGLKKWLEITGLLPEEVAAVGDSENDLPLFAAAGWKVAMGNAQAKLKQAADEIIGPVEEDGLAVFLRRLGQAV